MTSGRVVRLEGIALAAPFVSLHTVSFYSLLEGVDGPDALLRRAAEVGYDALALTDSNNLHGAVAFAEAARRHPVRPGRWPNQSRKQASRAPEAGGGRRGDRAACSAAPRRSALIQTRGPRGDRPSEDPTDCRLFRQGPQRGPSGGLSTLSRQATRE
jgi:hypothetical protein